MKCQHCNEKEATVFYSCTVNGKTSQQSLCSECAEALGIAEAFQRGNSIDRFFADFRRSWGGFDLLRSFGPLALLTREEEKTPVADPEREVPESVSKELQSRRTVEKLRVEMQAAAQAENFEEAARLRDQIRDLEQSA